MLNTGNMLCSMDHRCMHLMRPYTCSGYVVDNSTSCARLSLACATGYRRVTTFFNAKETAWYDNVDRNESLGQSYTLDS